MKTRSASSAGNIDSVGFSCSYVLGDGDSEPENLTITTAGAIAVLGSAALDLTESKVTNCWGMSGALHISGSGQLHLSSVTLVNNTGFNGGGLSVVKDPSLIMSSSSITSNIARNGGGLFTLRQAHLSISDKIDITETMFSGNKAMIGGGFYSDISPSEEQNSAYCEEESQHEIVFKDGM